MIHWCGSPLICLERGGCGGNGTLYGCEKCDQIFEQTTGGFFATPGGERLVWRRHMTLKQYRELKTKGEL